MSTDEKSSENPTSSTSKLAWSNVALIALFVAWIIIPGLMGILTPDRESSKSENRRLAQMPALATLKSDPQDWANQFTSYLQDQVGLRETLTKANGKILYNAGISPSEDVILGEDGFLFGTKNTQHNDILRAAFTENSLSDKKISTAINGWKKTASYAQSRSTPYLISMVPSKLDFYRSDLPKGLGDSVAQSSMLDQVEQAAIDERLYFLNLGPALQEQRDLGYDVWRKQDTHWNTLGAYAACRAIVQNLNAQSSQTLNFPADKNVEKIRRVLKNGDLARLTGLGDVLEEETDAIRFNDGVKEIDREELVQRGRVMRLDIKTNGLNDKTILISADSFMWASFDCFKSTFTRVVWHRSSDQEIPEELFEQYSPDYVINMNIEKSLLWLKE